MSRIRLRGLRFLQERDYMILLMSKRLKCPSQEVGRLLTWENVDGSRSPPFPEALRELTDYSGVLKAFLVQICILANHQNGKDTHLRGVKIFAPLVEYIFSMYGVDRSNASMEGPFFTTEHERMFVIR